MKINVDIDQKTMEVNDGEKSKVLPLYSNDAFEFISKLWVKVGWAQKFSYNFTWLGQPIIQLPEDIILAQEVIWKVQPDIIVETGIARGGSLIFYASLLELMGKKEVVGVDIDIRPNNRLAIEKHPMASRITLIEGSSTDRAVVDQVAGRITREDKVLVLLDSDHSRDHVLDELRLYAPLVSVGSYLIATDGIMSDLADVPGGKPSWQWDNPKTAAELFVAERDDFVLEEPGFIFQESSLTRHITYWPNAFVRRVK
jgi:cephalosporin hydroxylase